MAQQIIDIGTASDDGTGDTVRDAFDKTNDNFTEVYDSLGDNNTVYLRSEADLPNQTATTWEMDPNVPYKLAANFSTSLQCISAPGASISGDNVGGYTMSFTGTGAMFRGTDVDFYINNIKIDPGITNIAFEFDETVGSVRRFIAENVGVDNCAVWGKFTDLELAQITNCNGINCTQGVQFFGTNNSIWSITQLALISSNPAFKGLDLGTAQASLPEFTDLFMVAPAGAVGVSGLANSGNVPVGSLGRIRDAEFFGGMTDLSGLSVDSDIRWSFRDNTPTKDTQPDALISFKGNATETIISASSTDGSNAVAVAGTWVEQEVSFFSSTAGGRITYLGERSLKGPVDISLGLISSGGGAITVGVYIYYYDDSASSGAVISATGFPIAISGSDAQTITIPWQLEFDQNDYIEIHVENQTNTTNIIAENAVFRVL